MAESKLSFTVPGTPKGKARPRFNMRTKRTYTPDSTTSYENLVRVCFNNAHPDWVPSGDAVEIHIYLYFPVAQSWPKKKIIAALQGILKKKTKPDLDNVEKAILDGLNGVAWIDDAQIYIKSGMKTYDEVPRADITIIFRE